MIDISAEEIASIIAHIESIPIARVRFSPTRFPHTYAYDYLRSHAEEFGLPLEMDRGDCAAIFHGNNDKDMICTMLADAYLREWGISKSNKEVSQ